MLPFPLSVGYDKLASVEEYNKSRITEKTCLLASLHLGLPDTPSKFFGIPYTHAQSVPNGGARTLLRQPRSVQCCEAGQIAVVVRHFTARSRRTRDRCEPKDEPDIVNSTNTTRLVSLSDP